MSCEGHSEAKGDGNADGESEETHADYWDVDWIYFVDRVGLVRWGWYRGFGHVIED